MDCIMCVMSPSEKIAPACALARPLRSWLRCAIWPSLSFIAAGPLRLLLLDATSPLILVKRSLSSSKGGPPSNNSQTLGSRKRDACMDAFKDSARVYLQHPKHGYHKISKEKKAKGGGDARAATYST